MTSNRNRTIKSRHLIKTGKAVVFIMLILSAALHGCVTENIINYMFMERISVQDAVDRKVKMDKSENPAFVLIETKKLMDKRIEINNIKVKDIIASSSIDYNFCVVVRVPTNRGPVDCHIYANDLYQQEDVKTISRLVKGKTAIDVDGRFRRFFSLLDDTYTKIEITNAKIDIRDE